MCVRIPLADPVRHRPRSAAMAGSGSVGREDRADHAGTRQVDSAQLLDHHPNIPSVGVEIGDAPRASLSTSLAESISIRSGGMSAARMVASGSLCPTITNGGHDRGKSMVNGSSVWTETSRPSGHPMGFGLWRISGGTGRRRPRHGTGLDHGRRDDCWREVSFSLLGTAVPAWTTLVTEAGPPQCRLLPCLPGAIPSNEGACNVWQSSERKHRVQVDHISRILSGRSSVVSGPHVRDGTQGWPVVLSWSECSWVTGGSPDCSRGGIHHEDRFLPCNLGLRAVLPPVS